jgi:hypothetical protein
MSQHLSRYLAVTACTIICITRVSAAEYAAGFAVNARASYNDNIRLEQRDKIAVKKYNLSPTLTLATNTETDKFELDSTFDFNRFDKSEYNSNDQRLSMAYSHQLESSSIGLDATYTHNTTTTSETLTSGRVGTNRSELYTLSPNWTYTLTETNLIRLAGSYAIQDYQASQSASYYGHKDTSAELDWIYVLNDRFRFITAVTYSVYKYDDVELDVPTRVVVGSDLGGIFTIAPGALGTQSYATKTTSKGINIGLEYQWSEQSHINARFGRGLNRTSYDVQDPNQICESPFIQNLEQSSGPFSACGLQASSGPQIAANIDWDWTTERQQFNLSANKTTQATSNGYTVDSIQVGANWSYRLSELDKMLTGVSLVRNRAIDKDNPLQNTSNADRNYGSVTLQYQRTLTENWSLIAGYVYSQQKYVDVDNQASSRVYSLGITYRPQQWLWSR